MDLKENKITLGELWDNPQSRAVFQKRIPMLGPLKRYACSRALPTPTAFC